MSGRSWRRGEGLSVNKRVPSMHRKASGSFACTTCRARDVAAVPVA